MSATTLRFVVLSDLHVMPEGEFSVTLDTGARLEQAVNVIAERYANVDFCLLAGNPADLGQPAAFAVPHDLWLAKGNADWRLLVRTSQEAGIGSRVCHSSAT